MPNLLAPLMTEEDSAEKLIQKVQSGAIQLHALSAALYGALQKKFPELFIQPKDQPVLTGMWPAQLVVTEIQYYKKWNEANGTKEA